MRIDEAEKLADFLLGFHGLSRDREGWRVLWVKSKRWWYGGRCCPKTKTIRLRRDLVEGNEAEEVVELMLHEIAHALTNGYHGEVWREKAKEIGCSGDTHPRGLVWVGRPREEVYLLWRKEKADERAREAGAAGAGRVSRGLDVQGSDAGF